MENIKTQEREEPSPPTHTYTLMDWSNGVKIAILLKEIHIFKAISTQIPMMLHFLNLKEKYPKIYMDIQHSLYSQINQYRKGNGGSIMILNSNYTTEWE